MPDFTEEQRRAIERRDGPLLVSAGAGTGKTSVLVERFVRAVTEDEVAVDAILAITFTDKAAAQLKQRVRARFADLGEEERAREAAGAWISTIHGFCARLLRTHALAAGLDPEFRVLDGLEAERVAIDAFDRALRDFLTDGEGPEYVRLLAAYTPGRLADMVRSAYGHLRSRGERSPELPPIEQPVPAGEREELERAVAAAAAEVGAPQNKRSVEALDRLERCREALDRLPAGEVPSASTLEGLVLGKGANALKGPECDAYRAAHAACVSLSNRVREYEDHLLLRKLLALYGSHFARLKRTRSGVDFEDLQLMARDLLRRDEGVRRQYAERFAHVMVDEFQDTNPLQNELLGLLERDNLFRVGDERQSIYRFRHADVGVFQEHRDEADRAGRAERIGINFRSRGEVLDAIDRVFAGRWGESFDPLREAPGAREETPPVDPCVELLVVDKEKSRWDALFEDDDPFGKSLRAATPWRAAEARLLARRIDELTRGGPFGFGDVVVLVRATTHAGFYERALEDRGIPTHVLGGRGYWSQQQVGDLRAYLAALANPLDELSLLYVLASPLGGLSLDALVLLRAAGREPGRWDRWRTIEGVLGGQVDVELPGGDRAALAAFAALFREDRAAAPRVSLEALLDRVVTRSGYDRHVLAMRAGERRMANIRKLMRMAREFEADEGRDLRGFIDFVAERDLIQEREGQAPLEAEDLDAVRVMTIHRAKGLEFPVVCVADLGKDGREDDSALQISEDGRLGIRLASLEGGTMDSEQLARIKEQGRLDDEEEEQRVFYVAATRAERHLLLSGATDLEKLEDPAPLQEPMRWIWPALAPGLREMGPDEIAEVEWEGRGVRVRCHVLRPRDAATMLPGADRAPAPPEPPPPGLEALTAPALAAVPVPDALAVGRLSYSGLQEYTRCGYRFYLEKALRLPTPGELPASPATAVPGLDPLARGSVVHGLLQHLDFADPRPPAEEDVRRAIEAAGAEVREEQVADQIALVSGFAGSGLCARLGRAERLRTELSFAYALPVRGRELVMNGIVDVHATEPDRVLVVDYKSNVLGDLDPEALTEEAYSTQRVAYALAALRTGAERVEVVYLFLERPGDPIAEVYEASDAPGLERRLAELAEGVVAGRWEPTEAPHRRLCHDCPGRPALCHWGPERTLAEKPLATAG